MTSSPAPTGSTTELGIGRLAEAAGVSVETVRYYERRGLLDPPARTRRATAATCRPTSTASACCCGRRSSASRSPRSPELLDAADSGSIEDVTRAVHLKLAAIDAQVADLAATRCRLRRLVDLCEHGDHDACLQLQLTRT